MIIFLSSSISFLKVPSSSSSSSSSSIAVLSSSMSIMSTLAVFLLSTAVFIGSVAGTPKGFDYDIYDDPFNSPNIVKVNKVVDYYSKPQYAFGYEVDDYYSQLSHGRWEIRDGDVVQGQYRVLLPDGRIQIVSYIADKFGYRPTVEYIGKGAHPPPPPAYANIKPPVALAFAPVPSPALVGPGPLPFISAASPVPQAVAIAAAAPAPIPAKLQAFPTAIPILAATGTPIHKIKAPLGIAFSGTAAPFLAAASSSAFPPIVEQYQPVKIKLNSLPINGPFPLLDPYATGVYSGGHGGLLDPAFAASSIHNVNSNKISRKRALLYDRTLFRKDVEKRAAIIKKRNARVRAKLMRSGIANANIFDKKQDTAVEPVKTAIEEQN